MALVGVDPDRIEVIGVPPATRSPPRAPPPPASTSSRSARSSRGRTCAGGRGGAAGRRRAARRRRAGVGRRGRERHPLARRGRRRRARAPVPRRPRARLPLALRRGSGSRSWRRCRPARRWSPHAEERPRRSRAAQRSSSIPTTLVDRRGARGSRPEARRAARPRFRARREFQLGRRGRANARRVRGGARDRHRRRFSRPRPDRDETYVDNLLRALVPLKGELEIAAIVRDASLVPAGITPLVLRPGHRSCGWRGRCRCGSRACGRSSRTSSTRCRCSCERPRSSPSRT